jgi:hypothetical protein
VAPNNVVYVTTAEYLSGGPIKVDGITTNAGMVRLLGKATRSSEGRYANMWVCYAIVEGIGLCVVEVTMRAQVSSDEFPGVKEILEDGQDQIRR